MQTLVIGGREDVPGLAWEKGWRGADMAEAHLTNTGKVVGPAFVFAGNERMQMIDFRGHQPAYRCPSVCGAMIGRAVPCLSADAGQSFRIPLDHIAERDGRWVVPGQNLAGLAPEF